jgi:hypothetical protein
MVAIHKNTEHGAVFELLDGISEWGTPPIFRHSKTIDMAAFLKWIEYRVFPPERIDAKELLNELGLEKYDAWAIAKQTKASLMEDPFWVKIYESDSYEKDTIRGISGMRPISVKV